MVATTIECDFLVQAKGIDSEQTCLKQLLNDLVLVDHRFCDKNCDKFQLHIRTDTNKKSIKFQHF